MLYEKLVANLLYQNMNDNGYFSSDQSGFLCLHSTVMSLVDDSYNGIDLGKLIGVDVIDLKTLSILSTIISFAESSSTLVSKVGN